MSVNRRHIQIVLGLLWVLDGALQLQPFMFTTGFARQVIGPSALGQPAFVADPVRWASELIAAHPALIDSGFAAAQLAIGAGLLIRPTVRLALAASVGWAVGVWYFGEGLGGTAGGNASLLTGAPGAALIYAVLAVVAWPTRTSSTPVETNANALRPRSLAVGAWVLLWVGGGVLQALPGQSTPGAIARSLSGAAQGAPGWLAGWDRAAAGWAGHAGTGLVVGMIALDAAIAFLALRAGRLRWIGGTLGAVAALVMWVLGQGMGQIYSGQATDPNAGVLLIVLAVAVVSARSPSVDDRVTVIAPAATGIPLYQAA